MYYIIFMLRLTDNKKNWKADIEHNLIVIFCTRNDPIEAKSYGHKNETVWKKKTNTCKYFLAILKKFYEILKTLDESSNQIVTQAPANLPVFAYHRNSFIACAIRADFLPPPNCASFHLRTHTQLTFISTSNYGRSQWTVQQKPIVNSLTPIKTYIFLPCMFTYTHTHACTQL